MARYLVTGGAGFIGSHLAETLTGQGHDVVVLDNLSTGKRENLEPSRRGPGSLEFLEGDITRFEDCRKAAQGVDFVLHQAARASVVRSLEDPLATHQANATGSLNILEAARLAGVKRVVMASSSSVYGDVEPPEAPKSEDMLPRPLSPYAASKVAMEEYAAAYHRSLGLPTVCLRYFNVFGTRQDPESAYAAVIPKFLFALMEGQAPRINGDGLQSRDFTHVENVVAANLAACSSPKAVGRAVNIAAGRSHNLLELLAVLSGELGVEPHPEFGPPRTGDVRHSLADLTLARRVLGYRVEVGFREGLGRLVALALKGEYLAQ